MLNVRGYLVGNVSFNGDNVVLNRCGPDCRSHGDLVLFATVPISYIPTGK